MIYHTCPHTQVADTWLWHDTSHLSSTNCCYHTIAWQFTPVLIHRLLLPDYSMMVTVFKVKISHSIWPKNATLRWLTVPQLHIPVTVTNNNDMPSTSWTTNSRSMTCNLKSVNRSHTQAKGNLHTSFNCYDRWLTTNRSMITMSIKCDTVIRNRVHNNSARWSKLSPAAIRKVHHSPVYMCNLHSHNGRETIFWQ